MDIKKNSRRILSFGVACMLAFSFWGCGGNEKANGSVFENSSALTMTEFSEPVSLTPYVVDWYLQAEPSVLVTEFTNYGTDRLDKGNPVSVEYAIDVPRTEIAEEKLEVSLTETFAKIEQTLYFSARRSSVDIYNLLLDTTYYYRVSVQLENGDVHTKSSSFKTAGWPRFISLEGACNVRDIGGWRTENGKTIPQGLLYRGSEIDGGRNAENADFCLTDKGIEQLRALGIKTDFDLRSEKDKVSEYSVLGKDVSRTFYNAPQYNEYLRAENKETVRKIFSDIAKPESYPIYLHCTHGVDRAGSTVLILESLLGVSKENVIRDYELSAFYYGYKQVNRTHNNSGILALIEGIEEYEGETFADKTAAFLKSVGVTEAEISSIRDILLQ